MRVLTWPNATVQEGQQVNLTCLVWTAKQAPLSYTWYKGGQQLPGARSISLPNVTVIDATSYRCGVGLPGQAPYLSRPVTLDVLCESGWVRAVVERQKLMGIRAWESPLVCSLRTQLLASCGARDKGL